MRRIAGKIIGGVLGFIVGGPFWSIVGLMLGHLRDIGTLSFFGNRPWYVTSNNNDVLGQQAAEKQRQEAFAICVIVLAAKLSKVDGVVVREEIAAFKRTFRIDTHVVKTVGRIFDEARQTSHGYEPYAARLAGMFAHQPDVLEEVLVGLFTIALADSSKLSDPEIHFLHRIAVLFGFNERDFERIALRAGIHIHRSTAGNGRENKHLDQDLAVLGLSDKASNDEIKRTYRALIRKHHPDHLSAQGMPPELLHQATEKMKNLNAAYDAICRKRGIK